MRKCQWSRPQNDTTMFPVDLRVAGPWLTLKSGLCCLSPVLFRWPTARSVYARQSQFGQHVLDMLLNRPVVDDENLSDLSIRLSLCDQRCHFAFTLGESPERSFCGAARREWLLTRDQRSGLVQEMITERRVWNGGCQFLDQFLRSCIRSSAASSAWRSF